MASYDAIVVGARCAGSPTAMLLARKGYRVLLVERATFPSDTMSTLLMQPGAIARLSEWGLLDRIAATDAPRLDHVTMGFPELDLVGLAWSAERVTCMYGLRRTVLDTILMAAAREAGVEVREGVAFEDVIRDGERVIGIEGRHGSERVREEARIVIGADGMRSAVAKAVGAELTVDRPKQTCGYYAFYSGLSTPGAGLFAGDRCGLAEVPTNAGLVLVAGWWPMSDFPRVKGDIEREFIAAVDAVRPELGVRLRDAHREERFVGSGDLRNFLRKSHGPGWALVGDAGYHKDAITAQGITDAFKSAALLARHLDAGLSDRQPIDESTAAYERERDADAMPRFDWTCRVAEMRPVSPRTMELMRALRGNVEDTAKFLGLYAGTVLPSEFFAPDNVQRILATAR